MACIIELGEPVFIVEQKSQRDHWIKITPIEARINTDYGLAGIIPEKGKRISRYEWEVFWKYQPDPVEPSDLFNPEEFHKISDNYRSYPALPLERPKN